MTASTAMAATQARIAEIRATFQAMTPPRAQPLGVSGGGSTDFAAALGRAESAYRPGTAVTGNDVVAAATRYLGVPYRWGGTDPETGLDCSGFVQQVYEDLGIDVPRVSRDQAKVGTAVPSLAAARAGDLVAFGDPVDHIGIYVGHGRMIVAPQTGDVVRVQEVPSDWTHIRRVLPDASGGGGSSAYAALFEQAGARYGVDPALLSAVARAESGYNASAVSPAGALGLMQIMPGTARGLGVDPMDPRQAVDGAARLLSDHLRQYGSIDLALAAYNAGPGAVNRYGGVPPYAETQGYVSRILADLRSEAS